MTSKLANTLGAATIAALLSLTPARAAVVAVNGAVPATMNAGGVEGDPAEYIVGAPGPYDHSMPFLAYLGQNNSWNSLRIQESSTLQVSNFGLTVGTNAGANNNHATITGAGSSLTTTLLYLGRDGNANSMTVENGAGAIATSIVFIGEGKNNDAALGNNNSLLVTDTGSTFHADQTIRVGQYGSGNSMTIANGGSATLTLTLILGEGSTLDTALANNNSLTVTDTGSSLETSGLSLGSLGSSNTVTIANGASATSLGAISVGQGSASHPLSGNDNIITVSGEGSSLEAGGLILGSRGSGNAMTIEDGANVTVKYLDFLSVIIGAGDDSNPVSGNNNTITVTGVNSILALETHLTIGNYGSGNSLTVADGALVTYEGPTSLAISYHSGAVDNYLRLQGGYFAWQGDYLDAIEALLLEDKIQTWDPVNEVWVSANSSTGENYFGYAYFATNEEAFAYTGYADLGGYTILGSSPIPEPRHFATLAGLLALLLVICQRRARR